ncbi:copper oxidase [Apilactobacillus micheneri]|uniref:Copper oxidase n=1 Tax=Apilactobacillus micheneri TaxID=1899430 RepID=A0A9Q8IPI2_9LACO|nr:multicopper oxidase domain-containing protein [Apilactobacillus micheneri]TPR41174.1 copper oxidase [Apilactobacillus micheneri]TPR42755.1 copper oxidase [Apilactobacillus micheneri]TPR46281.1 copper oxidase [Apilactobacillus micheneri]TPR46966.1 copper oxidase [Apilactobacillus micheneri]TPR48558.1 copper oxidase [Apilactobacillus micheneri]
MAEDKNTINDYFFYEPAFNTHDGGYVPLEEPNIPEQKLKIPEALKPDKETDTDMYYTVIAEAGESQIMPGQKTKTWGYNQPLLGKTIIFKRGKNIHVTVKNELSELTTYHWHGLNVPGDIDGGCHTPVYPGESKVLNFKCDQPAATLWLHAHPCPSTAEQVWHGLATAVVVKDEHEASLPLPRNYGVDDIPLILQDRKFHEDNQWDYHADYDPDGVQGPTAMINGTVNPYFDVTTQKVRFRILDGANRREWRLHFSDNLSFTQIAGDGSLLEHPVKFTHLMLTCAERAEIVVDFSDYKPGDEVTLYSDDVPIVHFRIHEFAKDDSTLPDTLFKLNAPEVTPDTPVHKIVMSGMDEEVAINDKKFNMQRIDSKQTLGSCEIWEVTNSNDCDGGMIHPYHMHGCQFQVLSRNGKAPYPNETGLKDTIAVDPNETVKIKVWFDHTGVFMYHCHIIEHEDGGMMAQIEVQDPKDPQKFNLMDMDTLMNAFAKERGVKPSELNLGGMECYDKMNMKM